MYHVPSIIIGTASVPIVATGWEMVEVVGVLYQVPLMYQDTAIRTVTDGT